MLNSENTAAIDGLIVRAARLEDAEALNAMANLPNFQHWTQRLPYGDLRETRHWLEGERADAPILVALRGTDLLGVSDLRRFTGRRAHVAVLGIGVHDEAVGQGIGRVLLREILALGEDWMMLTRIELTVAADNERAIRLYRAHGFEEEGRHRQAVFRAGRFVDTLTMARIRP